MCFLKWPIHGTDDRKTNLLREDEGGLSEKASGLEVSSGKKWQPLTVPAQNVDFHHLKIIFAAGSGAVRAEDAHGTPTQNRISPSSLLYEDNKRGGSTTRLTQVHAS